MSLDPGPELGEMIRGAIMKRIGDPYYGAGISGGARKRKPGRPKKAKKAKKPKKAKKAKKAKKPKRKCERMRREKPRRCVKYSGGVVYGDEDYMGDGYSGGDGYCGATPYMGHPGNIGMGYSGGRKPKSHARSNAGKKAAKSNPWLKHLACVRAANPGLPIGELSKLASSTYHRR